MKPAPANTYSDPSQDWLQDLTSVPRLFPYRGAERQIPSAIAELAADPRSFTDSTMPSKADVIREADRIASDDDQNNRVIIRDGKGEPYLAVEHPHGLPLLGRLVSGVDKVPRSRDDTRWDREIGVKSAVGSVPGVYDHVVIEFKNGDRALLRRTSGPDVLSADLQTFDFTSTKAARTGNVKGPDDRRQYKADQLRDTIVLPGQPLVLYGEDGRLQKSDSTVARVTAFKHEDERRVDPRDKRLQDQALQRDPVGEFNRAMREAVQQAQRAGAASAVGAAALSHHS